jgi:Cobalamin synthesis protein cobW C-terminal domain
MTHDAAGWYPRQAVHDLHHPLLSLPRLQSAIGQLAPKLARAKGLFETVEQPGRQLLFQLAGGRARLAPARARIVFISEIGVLTTGEIGRIMDGCVSAVSG